MPELSEQILQAWLAVSAVVQNERIVSDMTYNEAVVCDFLWQQIHSTPDYLTATQLCKLTGMQKSLMNRTIKSLLAKEMIIEAGECSDHRTKPLKFNPEKTEIFLKTHLHSLDYVKKLMTCWSDGEAENVLQALNSIAAAAKKIESEA